MFSINIANNKIKVTVFLVLALCFILNIDKVMEYRYYYSTNKQVKKILFWNSFFSDSTFEFGVGSQPFVDHRCEVKNCYITNRRDYMPVDQYDAIVFHGAEYAPVTGGDLPPNRSTFQRYVYFSMESPLNRPLPAFLDGFYNWTMTYRLDSDIPVPYFTFWDERGRLVAPARNPQWVKQKTFSKNEPPKIFNNKRKAVAWFASNCNSKNRREIRVKELQKYISVDIYGSCGPFKCPRNDENVCFEMLKNDYFFYLSYENSNCEDYITEKLTNAMLNDAVPVVYGGADFARFLPPGSYIDATTMTEKDLASKLTFLMKNSTEYLEYFWWKDIYKLTTRHHSSYNPFCKLCEKLNSDIYSIQPKHMFDWWHGNSNHPVCS